MKIASQRPTPPHPAEGGVGGGVAIKRYLCADRRGRITLPRICIPSQEQIHGGRRDDRSSVAGETKVSEDSENPGEVVPWQRLQVRVRVQTESHGEGHVPS